MQESYHYMKVQVTSLGFTSTVTLSASSWSDHLRLAGAGSGLKQPTVLLSSWKQFVCQTRYHLSVWLCKNCNFLTAVKTKMTFVNISHLYLHLLSMMIIIPAMSPNVLYCKWDGLSILKITSFSSFTSFCVIWPLPCWTFYSEKGKNEGISFDIDKTFS